MASTEQNAANAGATGVMGSLGLPSNLLTDAAGAVNKLLGDVKDNFFAIAK